MNPEFWHKKWSNREIGFHQAQANDMLVAHFASIGVPSGGTVFVPLCGMTLDIVWLLQQGYNVVGSELSESAIVELFTTLGMEPTVTTNDYATVYKAPNITIYVGDIFALTDQQLATVDAIYDRAAIVALPADMRERYAQHLLHTTQNAPQLVITFEYDQARMAGPPFSVDQAEVEHHYSSTHTLTRLAHRQASGPLRERANATETVWLLEPKR